MNLNDTERAGLPSASDEAFWCCAGKQNLMAATGYPFYEEDDDAKRGTKIHKAFETGNVLDLDEEETETYQQGLKFLEMLLAAWGEGKSWVIVEGPREERFWIHDDDTMEPLASAKLDRHYFSGPHDAAVIDFKSGFVPNLTPSPRSTQLRVQLVALTEEHPAIQRIRVAFCKAKLKAGASDWCDYGPQDIAYARQWVRFHIWASRQPDAPRTPGKHCGYCPCKADCPEAGAYSMLPSVIARRAFPATEEEVIASVNALAPADLVKIWGASTVIGKILEAAKNRLKTMSDEQLDGLGLKRGKPREMWSIAMVRECFAELLKDGWSEEDIFSCMKFSNEPLEKTLRRYKGLPSDKAAKELLRKTFETLSKTTYSDAPLRAAD